MPPKAQPKCLQCEKNESPMWRNTDLGQLCHECWEQNTSNIKTEPEQDNGESSNGNNGDEKKLRKSTRATRFKTKSGAAGGQSKGLPKGRNRRNIFKKTPYKTPIVQAATHTVESCFFKGSYLQVGDIVSLMDAEDNVYYAQIRGLLIDTYCEKSAFLTWLIPTQASPHPNDGFDASTYLIGPDEDLPRKLSCLQFIMHAPSNYYHDKTTPFPLPDSMDFDTKPGGFIWTNLPVYERNKSRRETET